MALQSFVRKYKDLEPLDKGRLTYSYLCPHESTNEDICVKLFHQRWYLLGKFQDSGKLGVFAFDRIADVKVEEEKFTIDENFDAANYFCDSYGIVVDNSLEVQHIVLRAYGAERYYLRDLPIHHSQRVINTTDEYTDFEMKLRPTADFKAHLLSRGQWVEILEPQSLADEIIEWHQKAIDRYKKK